MIQLKISEINERVLQSLCEDLISESMTLEFKRELPGRDQSHKAEFLKDVSALANSAGGDLVFGIQENAGVASKLEPLNISTCDSEERRLAQILDSGVEPRITGIQFKWVKLHSGHALILRIPKSYDAPHRVMVHGNNFNEKFFIRSGTHTSTMSYEQLRSSFDRTASLTERAKAFRQNRIGLIKQGSTPILLYPGPLCLVHLIPLSSPHVQQVYDVVKLSRQDINKILIRYFEHNVTTLNLDGVVAHCSTSTNSPENHGYNQIFRNGCTETVFHAANPYQPQFKTIQATEITFLIRNIVDLNLKLFRDYSISGPFIIGISILGVEEYKFEMRAFDGMPFRRPNADRRDMIIPEVWIESAELIHDVDEVMRPLLDILWQAFGQEQCYEYDENGKWRNRRT